MTVLPIVDRELRVTARRRNTYWIRVVLALVAMAIGGWVMLFEGFRTPASLGSTVFAALSVFAFVYCLLAGLRATADCLSEEKREGTLGLLFLTDLQGYDIVFGKLAATSLNVLCGLLALLPVMTIPLLVGSVTAAEVMRVALVALNTLFFSLAAGMFASAVTREERRPMGLCFCILAIFTLGLPLIGALIADRLGWSDPPAFFFLPSPGFSCFLAFDDNFKAPASNLFVPSILIVHGLAWLLLVLACIIVPRAWQEKAAAPAGSRLRHWWRNLDFTTPDGRRRFRAEALDENPFYWLAARDRSKPAMVWLFLVISAGLWCWGWLTYGRVFLFDATYLFTGIALNCVLKVWIAGEACWRFSTDRNSGAMELMLATPLNITAIIRGQIAALVRQFAAPVVVVLVVELLFMQTSPGDKSWVLLCMVGIVMFVADLVTLAWVGMWLGVTNRHPSRAMGGTMGLVLVLPWVLFALLATFFIVTRSFRRVGLDDQVAFLLWLFIGLAVDLAAGLWARTRLRERFRFVVTERFVAAGREG